MKQSLLESFVESCANTVVGYILAFIVNATVLPAFGCTISILENISLIAIFSVLGILRGFSIRRYFEWLRFR